MRKGLPKEPWSPRVRSRAQPQVEAQMCASPWCLLPWAPSHRAHHSLGHPRQSEKGDGCRGFHWKVIPAVEEGWEEGVGLEKRESRHEAMFSRSLLGGP